MKSTIALHDAQIDLAKGINKFLIQKLSDTPDTNIIFDKLHGKLFGIYQKHQFSTLIWHMSEYTQELHDFIRDYSDIVKIYLVIDQDIDIKLAESINATNTNILLKNKTNNIFGRTACVFDNLYDHSIFYDMELHRNNKTVVLLSRNNDKNIQLLYENIYPQTNKPIVVVNNPEFESPVNLGIFNYPDLANILNIFEGVIDLDQNYLLESQASNIKYYDISNNRSIVDAIDNNVTMEKISHIEQYTYEYFVEKYLLPHMLGDK